MRDNTAGNVAVITAAAFIPLVCLIGSGVDISRAYAAQSRLQVACDAASLAGRRAMSNGEVDQTVRDEVTKFFNFNFPQGSFQTAAFTPTTAKGQDISVVVTAQTTIPTSIMKLFGFGTLPISATCNAKQDFVNTDILLVLDVTGSMDQSIGGTKKIASLRTAVLALYDELKPVQDKLAAQGLRLRYGIVPYSTNVNVGKIVKAQNANYIVSDNWTYQSRTPRYRHREYGVTKEYCDTKGGSWRNEDGTANDRCTWYNKDSSGTRSDWFYEPVSIDVSGYVTGNSTAVPTRDIGTTENVKWAGCIEERQTVSTIVPSTNLTIPSGAKDLDIDLIPSDNTSRWAPFWPEVEYNPDGSGDRLTAYCPAEAKRLTVMTRSEMDTYVKSLSPTGNTYLDSGLIWGARFISPKGIFKSNAEALPCNSTDAGNSVSYCSMPVARFLIFMTDGEMVTSRSNYTLYGAEQWDKRVTGGWTSESDQDNRHMQRTKMMCNAVKGMNVSVWTIAFGTSLTDTLRDCASSTSQASTSANQAELIAKFVEIGKNIGSLRLTQ
uniref:TadE/TadG family type IV pilus assembly protein n=1 Tax=Edaphosphingomonas laterariae TaxID=861865 RepID=UPI001FECF0E2|nr:TadE/TadG family type IV pilus assembly protein [Sphingomonas laterariae]